MNDGVRLPHSTTTDNSLKMISNKSTESYDDSDATNQEIDWHAVTVKWTDAPIAPFIDSYNHKGI